MINWRELTPHVLNQFPDMQDWEFEELKQSISEGFDDRMPIIIYKGEDDSRAGIVDGANRHRACLETSTIPSIKEFYGTYEEAMSFILRTNVRRNLNAGQKAAVVLDMDSIVIKLVEEAAKRSNNLPNSSNGPLAAPQGRTSIKLGEMAGVGKQTMKETMKIKQHDPQLYEYVKAGKISAKSAYTQIQDRITDGDAKLSQQRSAKSLLEFAIQEAIDEAKDELYQAALDIVTNSESNKVDFKLKLTII